MQLINAVEAAFSIDNPVLFPPAAHSNVGSLASTILKFLIAAAGILSFIFVIIAGIKIVTASGDSKKLASAQATLLYAIIGVIVAILALVIVNLTQKFLGTNVKIT